MQFPINKQKIKANRLPQLKLGCLLAFLVSYFIILDFEQHVLLQYARWLMAFYYAVHWDNPRKNS